MDRETLAQMSCPNVMTWTTDIQGLFTPIDVDHMKKVTNGALDLSSYQSVKIWATKVYQVVSSGIMPPAGSGEDEWTPAMVSMFACWIQQGCPQ